LAAENGQPIAEKGWGRFVKRPPLPPFAKALATWKELMAPKAVAREAVTP
jgi:dihydropyrimidinase